MKYTICENHTTVHGLLIQTLFGWVFICLPFPLLRHSLWGRNREGNKKRLSWAKIRKISLWSDKLGCRSPPLSRTVGQLGSITPSTTGEEEEEWKTPFTENPDNQWVGGLRFSGWKITQINSGLSGFHDHVSVKSRDTWHWGFPHWEWGLLSA